jgi:hypothetical protein
MRIDYLWSRSLKRHERDLTLPIAELARQMLGEARERITRRGLTATGGIFGRNKVTRRGGRPAGSPLTYFRTGVLMGALRVRVPRPGVAASTFRGGHGGGITNARLASILQYGIPGVRDGAGESILAPSGSEVAAGMKTLQALVEDGWLTRLPEVAGAYRERRADAGRAKAAAKADAIRSRLQALGIQVEG